ncbi:MULTISPECIES: aspartyl/asparaginyl beta-hydroxylase domain-containing protein [unclassified Pseudoalteromonas]|uniref:aspartyl/asparaginyl beta-hydroxylase domain-containing protein n=1 Tax=unclassified Pseudoalteromonas TaxID=194690 RepID=UPI001F320949|nr:MULTISPECIES: aspartyl/asparaginyl beta-hydroxylase domain-containing protein [unclassified Pseudoalteromonas]MCF2825933.1 aspartyl/asparaginyl beta-hydroxylase domain-containing protein [Pseudoalteromonas sp. OF5H-5]MCF2829955.1 aspartyl/asparaginyl beta-hydroxylase domain-containing protein [Pseudoalteromonas sp. DL2-H6]MCF2925408.1 aspartyl/asparaginyl beta-hydroxylase domain-containing protein [Pseudoalteromonas sp. DL2-H1]
MLDFFAQELNAIRQRYGNNSLERIEAMFDPLQQERDPLQEDARYIMPGLSTTPWLNTADYPALEPLITTLNKQSGTIKNEIHQAISHRTALLENYDHYLGRQDNWHALYLFQKGEPVTAAAYDVPATWEIFNQELRDWHCPLLEVHFSILQPGTVIKPHCDLWNFTLNLHLAVDIPQEDCSIIVAGEERTWTEGECLLFDYSYLHEAFNHSEQQRICLLMDIWHPDLTLAEREALIIVIKGIRELLGE